MADGLVRALIQFGKTLSDDRVEASQKLLVLDTLNDVELTLSELSESGLGRIVSRLKNEPGGLGSTARTLVSKWKAMLAEYMRRESVQASLDQDPAVNCTGQEPSHLSQRTTHQPSHPHVQQNPTEPQSSKKPKAHSTEHHSLNASTVQNSFSMKGSANSFHCNYSRDSIASCSNNAATTSVSLPKQVTSQKSALSELPDSDSKCLKRKREIVADDDSDSIDASSGMSFMESLCAGSTSHSTRKRRSKPSKSSPVSSTPATSCGPSGSSLEPSAAFTAEILSSLNEDIDRPDAVHPSRSVGHSGSTILNTDDDDDDGNLKFKSKKVLWVPKPSRNPVLRAGLNATDNFSHGPSSTPGPPSLVDLCLAVVERNLNRVDHVGQVPYELFGRVLRHATPEELAHIEKYNPQFVGYSDDLWQKHVQRDYHHVQERKPRAGETWCAFYNRIASDEADRLDRIINRSARKIKEEISARRTTQATEAIPPRQVQKRARQMGHLNHHPTPLASSSKSRVDCRPFGEPTNVSRPNSYSRNLSNSTGFKNGVVVSSAPKPSTAKSNGGLLNKLRKQFQSGRLR